jgi:LCP family protein required for cell wall assembly
MTAVVSAAALILTGMGWIGYRHISAGITTSAALADEPGRGGADQNILIMGVDSRRDQHGRPLPKDIYDALHAGDADSGEYDADALMVLHVPGGHRPVTAVSVPRDDYVDLVGCPASHCRGKVKHAYRLAYRRAMDQAGADTADSAAAPDRGQEQKAREAGRVAEIRTVERLLQIPIDHFIEVSLVAFFDIARVVEPVTVCLNDDTADPYYSGAEFHKGVQQLSAAQAVAFVRQRRDVNDASFTDLDRSRRQQAFIASVIDALRRSGAASNLSMLARLTDVAKRNVAVDAGFDLAGFLRDVAASTDSPVSLYTLPITEFSQTPDGQDVNIIDVAAIREVVHNLLGTGSPGPAPTRDVDPTAGAQIRMHASASAAVLDVINASGQQGLATSLEKAFGTGQFAQGAASTAESASAASVIEYGPEAQAAAAALADDLHLTATASNTVAPHTVQLTAGTDLVTSDYLGRDAPTTTSASEIIAAAANPTGPQAPAPTDLTQINADGVPCVK